MNVKKYRATTTREALEMIKQELGEDAFVLETKQIRSNGFFGLGANTQIEVSAAAPSKPNHPKAIKSASKSGIPSHRILNLTDEASDDATVTARPADEKRKSILSALSARAALSNLEAEISQEFFEPEQSKFEAVEISPDEPRLVHPRREFSKQIAPEQNSLPEPAAENAPVTASSRELELLRAEMREVKFSLGVFANRRNAQSRQHDIELEHFAEIFESPFHEVYVELTASGISAELARQFVADAIPHFKSKPVNFERLMQTTLLNALSSVINFEVDAPQTKKATISAVIGTTGVGKTTTIAKLAARAALYEQRNVELVTLDTYRIAAVEQLKTYAQIIGAGCHIARSVFELDAVLRRLPKEATVLIDTTGRSPHDLADQYELSDYLLQRKDIRKYLAVQATTNLADASAAIKKYEMYGADCLILTKLDETMQPGAVVEMVAEGNLPLAYFCTGQRVPEDLQIATAQSLTNRLLGKKN